VAVADAISEVRSFHEATWTADLGLAEQAPLYRMRRERENRAMTDAVAVITLADSMRGIDIWPGFPKPWPLRHDRHK